MNDIDLTKKRLCELSHRAYERGYTVYSDFLNEEEAGLLFSQEYDTEFNLFGGYDSAERVVAAFGDEAYSYPIVCIKISPVNAKFADKLSHRDFLGSLMNLGIERDTLGDIVTKDNCAYLFCLEKIAEYIIKELDRVKHTNVKCSICDTIPDFLCELPDEEKITVSSVRVDTVSSAVFNISRNTMSQLVNQQRVFINSKLIYKDSVLLKDNDKVSIRGYGKYIFCKVYNETRKHKQLIGIRQYK
ncbi:YlmH/Sll1252 family protein [uncultured Eubacterium sp.]|uniref:YlmH/Sll1252 family protein n=1 Tax=uncultured Eubacterium sp. TaxID=165185 RepID=UPI0015AC4728|nr:YlmH/Sll1252 family protein [uncultured Eubacterium sp.]